MEKNHEEWMVGFRQKFADERGEKTWWNAMMYCPWNTTNRKYAKTEEEARRALNHVYQMWNGEKVYDEKGKRYDHQVAGSIGVSVEHDRKTDEDMKIVKHIIRKRVVTEWETVEE